MKNKIFKLFSISLSVASISATSFAIVSCGNKNKNSWNDFKTKALSESAMRIIAATKPANWSDVNFSEISMKTIVNSASKSIIATINRNVQYKNLTTAVFEIDFMPKTAYNVNNWKCTIPPEPSTYLWSSFKRLALWVSANDLLTQARKASNWKDLKWPYGNRNQNVWITKDQPQFDIYGGAGVSDPYKGMSGEPTADETNRTVTAIISKKHQEGLYASDPIEATIKYDKTKLYNISEWTFKTTQQLQSYPKWKSIYIDQSKAKVVNDFSNFENNNWIDSIDGNTNFQKQARDREFSIDDILNKTGFSDHSKPVYVGDSIIKPIGGGYQAKLVFNFKAPLSWVRRYSLSLYINFKYQDPNDKNGPGNAFNYTWFAVTGKLID